MTDTTKPFTVRWHCSGSGKLLIEPEEIEEDMTDDDIEELLDDIVAEEAHINSSVYTHDRDDFIAWARAVIAARSGEDA